MYPGPQPTDSRREHQLQATSPSRCFESDLLTSPLAAVDSSGSKSGYSGGPGMDRRAYNLPAGMRELILPECSRSGPADIVRVEMVIPCTDACGMAAGARCAVSSRTTGPTGKGSMRWPGSASRISSREGNRTASTRRSTQLQFCRLEAGETAARYFGGMRFDGGSVSDAAWRDFDCSRFVLPRFELSQRGSDSVLACQWLRSGVTADTLMEGGRWPRLPDPLKSFVATPWLSAAGICPTELAGTPP